MGHLDLVPGTSSLPPDSPPAGAEATRRWLDVKEGLWPGTELSVHTCDHRQLREATRRLDA